jgi:serine/threonine protein kinase
MNGVFPGSILTESVNVIQQRDGSIEIVDEELVKNMLQIHIANPQVSKICFHLLLRSDNDEFHSNAVIIDNAHKEYIIYEPHGNSDDRLVNQIYREHRNKLKSLIDGVVGNSGYQFEVVRRKMDDGIQWSTEKLINERYKEIGILRYRYANEPEGYCTVWSLLFIHVNLLNPSMDSYSLYKSMVDKFPLEAWALKVRAYAATIYNYYQQNEVPVFPKHMLDSREVGDMGKLSEYIDELTTSYSMHCDKHLRENYAHTLKADQLASYIEEEPVIVMVENLLLEEKRIHHRHYQRMCKSDMVKARRVETVRYVLENCGSKLNAVVAVQLMDRYSTYSENDPPLTLRSIVDLVKGLYNTEEFGDIAIDRMLTVAEVLEYSFFEPNVYFFISIYFDLFPRARNQYAGKMKQYFFDAHMLSMTNHVYACLPSSYQFVGILNFMTRFISNEDIYITEADAFRTPITKLFNKTDDEIRTCGDLVNSIIYGCRNIELPSVMERFKRNLIPLTTEPTESIDIGVQLSSMAYPIHIVKKVDETFAKEIKTYAVKKIRNDFTIYHKENKTYKLYTCTISPDCLFKFFRELCFVNSELVSAYQTRETIVPILQIKPYERSLREYKHDAGLSFTRYPEIMNKGKFARYGLTKESALLVTTLVKLQMKPCFLQLSDMHALGFVHGNIKPDCIVFRDGNCFLSDFRFVRRMTTEGISSLSYTVPYSDDRMNGNMGLFDFFCDIFALGMTICSMFYSHFEDYWSLLDKYLVPYRGFEKFDNIPTIARYLASQLEQYDRQLSDLVSKMFASRKYRFTVRECLQHPFFSSNDGSRVPPASH